ncbi:MAG: PAS domain-containing protein, partial [Armatimonadota bacterium]|nr:PAS domain-containing protein [Armatimonadota bacterium]
MTGAGPRLQGRDLAEYLIENAHEGIWIVDHEAKTLYANEAMASMLGCTVEEMAGRSAFDFLFEEDLEKGRSQFADQLLTGEPAALDLRYRRKDGSALWTRASTSPLSSGKRRPAAW